MDVYEKTYMLAVKSVRLISKMDANKVNDVACKQLLRSATSVAANTREAKAAESKADFVHKLAIALKECDETIFWIELLRDTDNVTVKLSEAPYELAQEARKILSSIIITTTQRYLKKKGRNN